MKLFIAYAVLLALLLTTVHSLTSNVIKTIKTGVVIIAVNGSSANLVIKRDDGTVFEHQFNTASTSTNDKTLQLNIDCESDTTCIGSTNETSIKIHTNANSEVVRVSHLISDPKAQLTDCFSLANNTQWFGGPEQGYLLWPVQDQHHEELTPVSGNVQLFERYWLSSKGVYVLVDLSSPLFLDQNHIKNRHLCLIAKNNAPYRQRNIIRLDYEIGVFANPRVAQEHVVKNHFGKPTGHPDVRSVTHPIWSTWARYKKNVNETVVRKLAEEIIQNGFNNSQLEIDDNWETCYGSFNVNTTKFPNMRKMVSDLKAKGFRVTLWIHPFINEDCNDGEAYDYALKNDYFVKTTDGKVHTNWWDGGDGAGAIDFTNPKAVEWWVARVKKLEDLGFDSFKFDAGEVSLLPTTANLNASSELQPDVYTTYYVNALAQYFNNELEVRVGWRTQQLPVWVRMTDKDTRWNLNNGLPTLITALLTMNINGYVLVLPDMIGGNGYGNGVGEIELPAKQMFIRWLQANVFMPSLQYSFVPWDFDNETIRLSKFFTDMHANVSSKIVQLMEKAVQTGAPVNPPIWWVDPTNEEAHKIGDEFLLGEEILVAPVIVENAISRDVYLPSGQWRDGNTQEIYQGPTWLRNYAAPLSLLPHFYKL